MDPKEKANKLSMKFDREGQTDNAIKCALIAVDEIILAGNNLASDLLDEYEDIEFNNYWKEVKQELKKL